MQVRHPWDVSNGAQLSDESHFKNNVSNLSMRLGLELKYGDWVLDLDFIVGFNTTNSSSMGRLCADRGERCLPDELRFQMKDPDSKLFRILQNGRFAKLLEISHSSGLLPTSQAALLMNRHTFLFERAMPQLYGGRRRLLQTTAPAIDRVETSLMFRALQMILLTASADDMRKKSPGEVLATLMTVKRFTKAAINDLTPRLGRLSDQTVLPPVEAIKVLASVLDFVQTILQIYSTLDFLPPQAKTEIITILYSVTQASFCTTVSLAH